MAPVGPSEHLSLNISLASSFNTRSVRDSLTEYIKLSLLIFGWYLCSSCSSMISKYVLDRSSFPISLSVIQFALSATFALALGRLGRSGTLHPLSYSLFRKILPLCFAIIVSKVCFLVSVESSPLSFTHTIKSSAPIFAVLFSRVLLQYRPSLQVYLALGVICTGISLASIAELSVSVSGLALVTALVSTLANVIVSLISKVLFNEEHSLNSVSLSFYMSSISMVLLMPLAVYYDWRKIGLDMGTSLDSGGLTVSMLWVLLVLSGLSYFIQNLVSFMVLNHVCAVTFSVLGTMKRLFVIISSVIVFGNNISPMNGIGICIAVVGVSLYNRCRDHEKKCSSNPVGESSEKLDSSSSTLPKFIVLEI
mmetsp:Transcript_5523/g.8576  ORF Transcript_5523/g.8576 Transcript_5523/m.8576 type:complete len:365 (-) Transcript_5523:36-1130(-)